MSRFVRFVLCGLLAALAAFSCTLVSKPDPLLQTVEIQATADGAASRAQPDAESRGDGDADVEALPGVGEAESGNLVIETQSDYLEQGTDGSVAINGPVLVRSESGAPGSGVELPGASLVVGSDGSLTGTALLPVFVSDLFPGFRWSENRLAIVEVKLGSEIDFGYPSGDAGPVDPDTQYLVFSIDDDIGADVAGMDVDFPAPPGSPSGGVILVVDPDDPMFYISVSADGFENLEKALGSSGSGGGSGSGARSPSMKGLGSFDKLDGFGVGWSDNAGLHLPRLYTWGLERYGLPPTIPVHQYVRGNIPLSKVTGLPLALRGSIGIHLNPWDYATDSAEYQEIYPGAADLEFAMGMNGTVIFTHDLMDFFPFLKKPELGGATAVAEHTDHYSRAYFSAESTPPDVSDVVNEEWEPESLNFDTLNEFLDFAEIGSIDYKGLFADIRDEASMLFSPHPGADFSLAGYVSSDIEAWRFAARTTYDYAPETIVEKVFGVDLGFGDSTLAGTVDMSSEDGLVVDGTAPLDIGLFGLEMAGGSVLHAEVWDYANWLMRYENDITLAMPALDGFEITLGSGELSISPEEFYLLAEFMEPAFMSSPITVDGTIQPAPFDFLFTGTAESMRIAGVPMGAVEIVVGKDEGIGLGGTLKVPGLRDGDGAEIRISGTYDPSSGGLLMEFHGDITVFGFDVLDADLVITESGLEIGGTLSIGDFLSVGVDGWYSTGDWELSASGGISVAGVPLSDATVRLKRSGVHIDGDYDLEFTDVGVTGYATASPPDVYLWGGWSGGHIDRDWAGDYGAEASVRVTIGSSGASTDVEIEACFIDCVDVSNGFEITGSGIEFRVLGKSFTIN